MKVCIGKNIESGSWGGGNSFVKALKDYLLSKSIDVVHDLTDQNIDVIIIIDPRPQKEYSSISIKEIRKYKKTINSSVKILQRVNECDERKNTSNINFKLKSCHDLSDKTVFISNYLKKLFDTKGWNICKSLVIKNGSDNSIFNSQSGIDWKRNEQMKLVTHHWSSHYNKGFDVYKHIDEMLDETEWKSVFGLTYIGNLPKGFKFKNVIHQKPRSSYALSVELQQHHVYLSASINEPAGMHHIEGALCGLPIIYRNSGALPEYCAGYGEEFSGPNDIKSAIERMIVNYDQHKQNNAFYSNTSVKMCEKYLECIESM